MSVQESFQESLKKLGNVTEKHRQLQRIALTNYAVWLMLRSLDPTAVEDVGLSAVMSIFEQRHYGTWSFPQELMGDQGRQNFENVCKYCGRDFGSQQLKAHVQKCALKHLMAGCFHHVEEEETEPDSAFAALVEIMTRNQNWFRFMRWWADIMKRMCMMRKAIRFWNKAQSSLALQTWRKDTRRLLRAERRNCRRARLHYDHVMKGWPFPYWPDWSTNQAIVRRTMEWARKWYIKHWLRIAWDKWRKEYLDRIRLLKMIALALMSLLRRAWELWRAMYAARMEKLASLDSGEVTEAQYITPFYVGAWSQDYRCGYTQNFRR